MTQVNANRHTIAVLTEEILKWQKLAEYWQNQFNKRTSMCSSCRKQQLTCDNCSNRRGNPDQCSQCRPYSLWQL
jgi:hypothetical protein